MNSLQPISLQPWLRRICWGGRRLQTVLGKQLGEFQDYAESWEVADHTETISTVSNGPFKGSSLRDLLQRFPSELLGRHAGTAQFPLLVKFLDANDWLSLQVHPNDKQAAAYSDTDRGKTEFWVILDAEPDNQICCGLLPGVDRRTFADAIAAGNVSELLHRYSVSPGDCIYVPAGTVHALGPGILLAEIQQQSNLTFRIHDWNRVDLQGQPRQLHIPQALDCIDFERGPVKPLQPQAEMNGETPCEQLLRCEYFRIRRYSTATTISIRNDDQCRILMLLEGQAGLESADSISHLCRGTTVLIPACCSQVHLHPTQHCTLLDITID